MPLRSPNGPEGFITTFKDLGSLIAIYDEIDGAQIGLQSKLVAAVEQMDYDFGTVKSLPTFLNNMTAASNNLDTAFTNLNSAVTNYLTTVLGPDINSTATTASGVLADMITCMQGATTGAAPSGIFVLLSGHFHTYFLTEYGIGLPVTSGSVLLTQSESMSLISGTQPSIRRQILDSYAD
jgi:hypothetical protein